MLAVLLMLVAPVWAPETADVPSTADHSMHAEPATQRKASESPSQSRPAIPGGMTLDDVLDYAASPPPTNYPEPLRDDRLYAFTLFEQLEYRFAADDDSSDRLGWDAQGWIGSDFNKFWWKNEGEAIFDGSDEGETETDLLYSRLLTPFWNLQLGVQYANEWNPDDYEDRWSGVIALQGLAPYEFELDNSLYVSEDGDVTFEFEVEYSVRVTQRLVMEPRAELTFAAQDIPERDLGAGLTDVNLDLRLRYEIKREFAPYIGVRHRFLVGETRDVAKTSGADTGQYFLMSGFRFAF